MTDATNPDLPLKGLRVIEFCWVWAGPMMGQHLADLGAEVVKVEWYKRYDLYRTRGVERLRGKIPEDVRRESSYSFQSLNRNKLGFAADLKRDDGLAMVKDLISKSDILLENFTVGTLDRLGLDAAELERLNDKLVVISLSATGRGSSIESLRSYGLMLSALGGYESLITDEDGGFLGSPTFVMSDPNAALFGIYAALAGTLHARQTGRGATYECSQVEAVASLIDAPAPPDMVQPAVDGIVGSQDGHYLAISLSADGATKLGVADLSALVAWAAGQSSDAIVQAVQDAGGQATRVDSLAESETSDIYAGTQVRQAVDHPVSGHREIVATPWLINGERPPIASPAPRLGGDSEDVMRDILGYDGSKIDALKQAGAISEPEA